MIDLNEIYYSALVVNDNDPNKSGLVQIRIESKHAEVSDANLPWAIPVSLNINVVPLKGSRVWVTFQQNLEYAPVYHGYVLKTKHMTGILAEDYPNTVGLFDGTNWITLNRKTGKIHLHNNSADIIMDNAGVTIIGKPLIRLNPRA